MNGALGLYCTCGCLLLTRVTEICIYICVCVCVLHYFRLRRGPKAHAIMRTIRAEFSRNTNVKVRMALNTTNFVQDERN